MLCLCVALGSLAVIDARFKLALWRDSRRTMATIAAGLVFFLAWDISAIHQQLFYIGSGQILTGWRLMRQLPVEEPLFLILLMYQTIILWGLIGKWRAR